MCANDVSATEVPSRLPDLQRLADLLTPHALRAVVTLGIPDLIDSGVSDPGELARRTGTDERVLSAVLAYLATRDVFHRTETDEYRLTDLGELLVQERPKAHLHLDLAVAPRELAFAGLLHTLRTGEPGYGAVFPGREYWDDLGNNPVAGADFDIGLQRWAETWLPLLLRHLDVAPGGHVVDIGGGIGVFVTGLLREHPTARATLVDLPDVVERAREFAAERDVDDRLHISGQSFFDPLPAGGDLYLLAQVLHDWPDEQCVAILRRAAEAAGPTGRVFVVERLLDDIYRSDVGLAFHLQMVVTFGGGERDEAEYATLAEAAGLRHARTVELGSHLWALEFTAAERDS